MFTFFQKSVTPKVAAQAKKPMAAAIASVCAYGMYQVAKENENISPEERMHFAATHPGRVCK